MKNLHYNTALTFNGIYSTKFVPTIYAGVVRHEFPQNYKEDQEEEDQEDQDTEFTEPETPIATSTCLSNKINTILAWSLVVLALTDFLGCIIVGRYVPKKTSPGTKGSVGGNTDADSIEDERNVEI